MAVQTAESRGYRLAVEKALQKAVTWEWKSEHCLAAERAG